MSSSKSKDSNPYKDRNLDPDLLKKGLYCDLDQYEILKRCSEKKDISEWNQWRIDHPDEDILLEGADLAHFNLKGINFSNYYTENEQFYFFNGGVYLEKTYFFGTNLNEAKFSFADLTNTILCNAQLKVAEFEFVDLRKATFFESKLQEASFTQARVDAETLIRDCYIDKNTNFEGVGLGNIRITPGERQLLEYNIRRKNWEKWYPKQNRFLSWIVWTFWEVSDYGLSTGRIIFSFFGLAFLFSLVYWRFSQILYVNGGQGEIQGFIHALYFSIVTMTTLGFGDIAANPGSVWGQVLLMFQVILGYVLLGALITRFAVLFTAGGPAGRFAKPYKNPENRQGRKDSE